MAATTLTPDDAARLLAPLEAEDNSHARRYPGDSLRRQPVHTVYGGAQLFRPDTAVRLGALARRALDDYAPDATSLTAALSIAPALADVVHGRVRHKLATEPVEDFRIDFEDGYGNRSDGEEDGHAAAAAAAVARGMAAGTLPPYIGIRIKPLSRELRTRAIRTLDIFITTLLQEADALPPNFVVTLPKVVSAVETACCAQVLQELEQKLRLPDRALTFEFMVETPQIVMGADGRCPLPLVLEAAAGRAVAAHFGTYDYTAACNITAAEQRMRHPACGHARHVMQVAFAGTGLWLSDGSTAVLPVPPHRVNESLTDAQRAENVDVVHGAWKLHYDDVQDSLLRGFYQGWDLHPAQLVSRYAALYEFFLRGLDPAADRLRNFIEKSAQATLVGDTFDDAATGQGLLNFFLRAINAGAVSEEETVRRTGLTLDELRGRSFSRIMQTRRG